jgi:hypothetical protein
MAMRKTFKMTMAIVFILLLTIPAITEAGDLTGLINDINKQAQSDLNFFKTRLEKDFGIPGPDLNVLFKTLPTPADVFMCLRVSKIAGIHTDIVVKEFKKNKGKGWGVIARNLGIKPGSREFHELKKGYSSSGPGHSKGKGKSHGPGKWKGGGGGKGKKK